MCAFSSNIWGYSRSVLILAVPCSRPTKTTYKEILERVRVALRIFPEKVEIPPPPRRFRTLPCSKFLIASWSKVIKYGRDFVARLNEMTAAGFSLGT